ncbi:MAG TPA: ferrochelatase [bacterium]
MKRSISRCALLLGFGSPSAVEDIEAFLKKVTGKESIPPEYVNPVVSRYKAIGGRSPFIDIALKQAELLQNELTPDGTLVMLGLRYSNPTIQDAVRRILAEKIDEVIGMPLTPHYSAMSTGEYFKALSGELKEYGNITLRLIDSWYSNRKYIGLLSKRIQEGIAGFGRVAMSSVCVLFTAHSLPLDRMPGNDPYVEQLKSTINSVVNVMGDLRSVLAFQSRRPGRDKWLEPEALKSVDDLASKGIKNILVVPLSFVSDHLETLYDIDIQLKNHAEAKGIKLIRAQSFNTDPEFIDVLADIIHSAGIGHVLSGKR